MIRNLIFDVGNVLIGYRWQDMLQSHGCSLETAEKINAACFEIPIWHEYDKGNVTLQTVVKSLIDMNPDIAEPLEWFVMNPDLMVVPRPRIYQRVRELRAKGYRIYLLSNYSREYFQMAVSNQLFNKDIDGGVISYEVGLIKPDPAIYKHLLEKYNLKAEECLFYDDRSENVAAAKALGMGGYVIDSEETLWQLLSNIYEEG